MMLFSVYTRCDEQYYGEMLYTFIALAMFYSKSLNALCEKGNCTSVHFILINDTISNMSCNTIVIQKSQATLALNSNCKVPPLLSYLKICEVYSSPLMFLHVYLVTCLINRVPLNSWCSAAPSSLQ